MAGMEPLPFSRRSVFSEGGRLYTANAYAGTKVYGERIVGSDKGEYREWNPRRSKLAAYFANGGKRFPFRENGNVLYLGAASGTTASHVSDLVPKGTVYCVEFSPRTFRDLVSSAGGRGNMIPILGDATKPDEYQFMVGNADMVYSDVAQKRQADILADNMERFGARFGMVCVKARSEDVTASPEKVFAETRKRLTERGMKVLDCVSLEPYEKDHAMVYVERPRTAYCVVLSEDGFLMIRNERRGGWEMPGGKLEEGETSEEGVVRECLEESGYLVKPVARLNMGDCDAVACTVVSKERDGEMEPRFFKEIPEELSFTREEYERVLAWAGNILPDLRPSWI